MLKLVSTVRSIRLGSPETLADPRIEALIATALGQAGWPKSDAPTGAVIIKSISPKQRPRRPVGA